MAAIARTLKGTGEIMLGILRLELVNRKHEGPANIAINVDNVLDGSVEMDHGCGCPRILNQEASQLVPFLLN